MEIHTTALIITRLL